MKRPIIAFLVVLSTAFLTPACALDDDEPGGITIPLTTVTPDGVYTLTGTLAIAKGSSVTTVDLATVPDDLTLALKPGNYTVTLSDWTLSLDGDLVDASLISANPVTVRVKPRETEELHYRFVTAELLVDFSVNETAYWFIGSFVPGLDAGSVAGEVPSEGLLATTGGTEVHYLIIADNVTHTGDFGLLREWQAQGAKLELNGSADFDDLSAAYSNQPVVIHAESIGGSVRVSIRIWHPSGGIVLEVDESGLAVDDTGLPILAPFQTTSLVEAGNSFALLYDLLGNAALGRAQVDYGNLE